MESEMSGIAKYMENLLQNYERMRGKSKDSHMPFWDVVTLTTGDEEQKRAFEIQIEDKLRRHELPADLPIHVVVDPPGHKLGNGGSTLTVLSFLHSQYGKTFLNWRVLVIHAGGYSMRLPSATILGKIFSPLPLGRPLYQMLDIKLAMYLPFIPKMPPGIFVTCADTFEVYDLGGDKSWKFGDHGFTALAHPSNIDIGVTHGVYVLTDPKEIDADKLIQSCCCKEVLQKPSKEKMKEKKAIIETNGSKFPNHIEVQPPVVYTDSVFFFASDVSKKFLNFINEHGDVQCEIDAYGDFLQALGTEATVDYIHNTSNISHASNVLTDTRSKIFHLLKGTDLTLLLMNASKFIHIGTTREYLHHFCVDAQFRKELGLNKDAFNICISDDEVKKKVNGAAKNLQHGCIMHSCITEDSVINTDSVLEYGNFDVPIHIQSNSIVSNCQFLGSEENLSYKCLEIPPNLFLHTVSVCISGQTYYATMLFDIEDGLKKNVPVSEMDNLSYMRNTLGKFRKFFNVSDKQILAFEPEGGSVSLWTAKLFPLKLNMSSSFETAIMTAKSLQGDGDSPDFSECNLVSMADALKYKDVDCMLKYRHKLFQKITS